MASGLPDYYRGVDIALQGLSEVINRPKYGGAQETAGGVVVTAGEEKELASISGKGMIYGGLLFLEHTASQSSGIPKLTVDGNLLSAMSFITMNDFNITKQWAFTLYLMTFDEVLFRYAVAVSNEITFETGFKLIYEEKENETPTVYFDLIYALI